MSEFTLPPDPPPFEPRFPTAGRFLSAELHSEAARPQIYESLPTQPPATDLRRHPRYLVARPVMAVPVLPDGGPDIDHTMEGITVDISEGGIGFEVQTRNPLTAKTLVLGIEADDGSMRFGTVSVRCAFESGIGMRIGAQFFPPEQDLFRADRVTPTFNSQTFTFKTGLSDEALTRWGLLGVVRPMVLDWVQVCFQCQSLLTYRKGCPGCGSARTCTKRLVHHFACAHVAMAMDFEHHGSLQCPKCLVKNLVVGADFEFLDGPFSCMDCNWKGTDLQQIAQCLRCRVRFPAHRVIEKEVIGYHVCRLDPLAFVPTT